jgi:hypothetical protein
MRYKDLPGIQDVFGLSGDHSRSNISALVADLSSGSIDATAPPVRRISRFQWAKIE